MVVDEQPVKPKVTYNIHVNGLLMPLVVTCDDIQEHGGYIRYYDGETPAAIIPVGQLIAAVIRPPKPAEAAA